MNAPVRLHQAARDAVWPRRLPRVALAVLLGIAAGVLLAVLPPTVAAVALLVPAFVAAGVDVRTRRIPNAITAGGVAAALVFALATATLMSALAGLGVAGGVALLMRAAAQGRFGMGDVKLLAYAGAVTGPAVAPLMLVATALAGAVLALAALAWHRHRDATMAYGPAIAIGLAVAVLANL